MTGRLIPHVKDFVTFSTDLLLLFSVIRKEEKTLSRSTLQSSVLAIPLWLVSLKQTSHLHNSHKPHHTYFMNTYAID